MLTLLNKFRAKKLELLQSSYFRAFLSAREL